MTHMKVFMRQNALVILEVCLFGTACVYPAYAYIGSNAGAGQARDEVEGNMQERAGLREEQQAERTEAREEYREEYGKGGYSPEERATIAEERRALLASEHRERQELHFAQQNEMYTTLAERRATIVARSEERRMEREQNREEHRARLTTMAQERLGGYGARVTEGMERVLEQLTDMAGRLEDRMARFSEAGIDVSGAERIFAGGADGVGVYALIDVARADVIVLATLLSDALASEDPKSAMVDVREASSVAKESIKLAHVALRDTVVELGSAIEARSYEAGEATTYMGENVEGGADGTEQTQ